VMCCKNWSSVNSGAAMATILHVSNEAIELYEKLGLHAMTGCSWLRKDAASAQLESGWPV
jgi:hypothetical protein